MSKFGLDYLIKKDSIRSAEQRLQAEQVRSRAAEDVERATASLGRAILSKLKTLKDEGHNVYKLNDLVDAVNIDRDTLAPVVERMAELRLLDVEREKYGNHSVRLTKTGEETLNLASL